MTGALPEAARPADSLLVRLGNVVFRVRDGLFPAVLVLLFVLTKPEWPRNDQRLDDILDVVGVLVAMLGQALRVAVVGTVYVIRGGRNRKVYAEELVSGGFFAHCRNPLYVGNLLVLLGLFVIWNSTVAYLVAVPFFLVAYSAIVAAEENFLRGKFGEPFDEYCARVPRWIPRLRGLRASLVGDAVPLAARRDQGVRQHGVVDDRGGTAAPGRLPLPPDVGCATRVPRRLRRGASRRRGRVGNGTLAEEDEAIPGRLTKAGERARKAPWPPRQVRNSWGCPTLPTRTTPTPASPTAA